MDCKARQFVRLEYFVIAITDLWSRVVDSRRNLSEMRKSDRCWEKRNIPATYLHFQPVHVFRQIDLTPEPRRVRQIVGQVQHVELLVRRLVRQLVEVGLGENQVASTARQSSFAGTEAVKVKVAVHDHVQQAIADLSFRFDALATGPHERKLDPDEEIDSNLI